MYVPKAREIDGNGKSNVQKQTYFRNYVELCFESFSM